AEAYLREDLRIQRDGVEKLYMTLPILAGDPTTYDIIKGYLQDEEEDLYWSEGQIELIEKIGIQNWLIRQL
ncbi:MAG: hypothetical protein IJ764_06585, partial [Bacteroidales bacterium]|nr:hypothetical protein [Bacteroidales bacterium]